MTIKKLIASLSLTLALASCKSVEVTDGRLPEEALPLAEKFVGEYVGSLRLESTDGPSKNLGSIQATLQLVDYNKPVLSFNVDTLGTSRCSSEVKLLEKLVVNDKETQLQGRFDFDPANCRAQVLGRSLEFKFTIKKNGELALVTRVYKETRMNGGGIPHREQDERLEYIARMKKI
jgi:hypothetical protein